MNAKVATLLILIALLFIPFVTADQTSLGITLSKSYLVVNGDHATITVNVKDSATGNPIEGAPVDFLLNTEEHGTLSPPFLVFTDSYGVATNVFTSTTIVGKSVLFVDAHQYGNWTGDIIVQGYPDVVNLIGNKDWLVAGDTANKSILTVTVTNQTHPIPMMNVRFSVLDSTMGSVNYTDLMRTDLNGQCAVQFTPSTKSGNATIQVVAYYSEGGFQYSIPAQYIQKIDHAKPDKAGYFDAPSDVYVGSTANIILHYIDVYGNPIDNKRYTEYATFSVTSPTIPPELPPYGVPAGFFNGTGYSTPITVALDATGNATVTLRTDTIPGYNIVTAKLTSARDEILYINGITVEIPVSIEQYFSPSAVGEEYPHIPADGVSVFNITYVLKDQFGNNIPNSQFWLNTTLGESHLLTTNISGMIKTTYGQKIRTDLINITATAVLPKSDGTHANISQRVEITSLEPVMMVMTANPQFLPSWDVPGGATSTVKAVVMDRYGNPVKNQKVNLTVVPNSWSYNYTVNGVTGPKWKDNSSITLPLITLPKEDPRESYASADFQPGYLPGFGYPQIHDSARVTATWNGYTQTAVINWTNVPFLSVSTNVTPYVAAWNDIITVNLRVDGNGYALKPKPIDVVLVIDRSGSMSGTDISPSRMSAAKTAAKNFVDKMDMRPDRDRVGLVSFGSDVTINQGLTNSSTTVKNSINTLSASGATDLREAYYEAIKQLKLNGRDNAVKAVIVMTDGDWNIHGNPLARGYGYNYSPEYSESYDNPGKWPGKNTIFDEYQWYNFAWYGGDYGTMTKRTNKNIDLWYWNGYQWQIRTMSKTYYRCGDGGDSLQNMSVFASDGDKKIKVYTIGFASNLDDDVESDLTTLSEATGGWYQWAGDATALNNLYTNIAGLLREEAGVGVTMDLPFQDITVSSNVTDWNVDGNEIFSYIPYTDVWKYWFNTTPPTTIYHYTNRDDSTNWTNGDLNFAIGTMNLNQSWETTFHLKLLETDANVGKITIFDQNSLLHFSDGHQNYTLPLPNTFITCIGNQSQTQISSESAGYEFNPPSIQGSIVTETFTRQFFVNETPWLQPWFRTWYEDYYLEIPGYYPKNKIGSKIILAPVPLIGSYTFDLSKYLPSGVEISSGNYKFTIVGHDITGTGATNKDIQPFNIDRNRIYIILE